MKQFPGPPPSWALTSVICSSLLKYFMKCYSKNPIQSCDGVVITRHRPTELQLCKRYNPWNLPGVVRTPSSNPSSIFKRDGNIKIKEVWMRKKSNQVWNSFTATFLTETRYTEYFQSTNKLSIWLAKLTFLKVYWMLNRKSTGHLRHEWRQACPPKAPSEARRQSNEGMNCWFLGWKKINPWRVRNMSRREGTCRVMALFSRLLVLGRTFWTVNNTQAQRSVTSAGPSHWTGA